MAGAAGLVATGLVGAAVAAGLSVVESFPEVNDGLMLENKDEAGGAGTAG